MDFSSLDVIVFKQAIIVLKKAIHLEFNDILLIQKLSRFLDNLLLHIQSLESFGHFDLTFQLRIAYTYRLTCTHSIQIKQDAIYYMGYRNCNCLPNEDDYYSSSDTVRELVKQYGIAFFQKKNLGVYAIQDHARSKEVDYHRRLDVANNPKFLNLAAQTSTGFFFDNYGRVQTPESNQKRSEAQMNKPKHTPKSRTKIAEYQTHTRERSAEEIQKLSESAKERNSTKVECPYCGKMGQSPAMHRWHFDNCPQNPCVNPRALEDREKQSQITTARNKKGKTS